MATQSASKEPTRRRFVQGAASLLGVAGAIGLAGITEPDNTARASENGQSAGEEGVTPFEQTVSWGDEYDVVVVGYGGAGACAAIAAADEGARVLVLEKAPESAAGGNTRLSGGSILWVTDEEAATTHYRGLAGAQDGWSIDEDAIATMVREGALVRDWLLSLGMREEQALDETYVEWPEYEGGDGFQVFAIEGDFNSAVWKLDKQAVAERADLITVWYEAPVTSLIQDGATGIVHGVRVEVAGLELNVRAKDGVVIACGGYENSPELQQQYNYQSRVYPIGTPYNTGDGIRMTQAVGADLWHMSCWAGPSMNFVNPETGTAAGTELVDTSGFFGGGASGFAAYPVIFVGNDGKRFMNEKGASNHGHHRVQGTMGNMFAPREAWCVFDETARSSCRVYSSWSEGAEEELEKGWVFKGGTLEELARACGIDADGLTSTVANYAVSCAAGEDADFGSDPAYMLPLETGPFYAIPLSPTMYNTYGGPRRDARCRIVDPGGAPIPHLFGAGECGSFWGFLYQGGGAISETMYSGWLAGRGAAAEKEDNLRASVMDGKEPAYVAVSSARPEVALAADEYLGEGTGIGGPIYVKVRVTDGSVASVEVVSSHETQGIGTKAVEQMPELFVGVAGQGDVDAVDGVSGATITSQGLRDAVKDALAQAGR